MTNQTHMRREVEAIPSVIANFLDKSEAVLDAAAAALGRDATPAAVEAPGALVLAADTSVAVGRRILAKPEDEADARRMLTLLSGRRHKVFTAVTLAGADGKARHRLCTTVVAFKRFSDAELDAYLASGEWAGKAGAYGIQGRAEAYVRFLSGSYSNVVGLPLYETRALLEAAGYPFG